MKTPSPARQRTLALQRRALEFSTGINISYPKRFTSIPSETIWKQLVRAADSVSNNLVEGDSASSGADFLHKIRLTLREARESRLCLEKIRLASLNAADKVTTLESEAGELCAIFAAIGLRVSNRLARERAFRRD